MSPMAESQPVRRTTASTQAPSGKRKPRLHSISRYRIGVDVGGRAFVRIVDLIREARIMQTESRLAEAIRMGRIFVAEADEFKAVPEAFRYVMSFGSFSGLSWLITTQRLSAFPCVWRKV